MAPSKSTNARIATPVKSARIYVRVSTEEQDVSRQMQLEKQARESGYYIAGVYKEKASGARADRPELLRMIADLQQGDVVIAEKMDRITRLPLDEAERLIDSIKAKGAKLAIPGIVDFTELVEETKEPMVKLALEAVQGMLLKMAMQMARDDYETRRERQRQGVARAKLDKATKYPGRKADPGKHAQIIALRKDNKGIAETARLTGQSASQVKLIWARYNALEGLNADGFRT